MPDRVPSRLPETSEGIMALLNTVASSAPMMARAKERSTSGAMPVCPGTASHSPHKPNDQQHGETGDPRLPREAGIGDGAENRRKDRRDQLGAAGGIGPQRGAERRILDEAVHEIGREQEGDDEGVEGLRRPVEQHPAGKRERAGPLRRLGPALPFTLTSGHRARSDDWAAHHDRCCLAENARRGSCRRSRWR